MAAALSMPPPPEPGFVAVLPVMLVSSMVTSPSLKMPPPSAAEVLPLIEEPLIEMIPPALKMPPPPPALLVVEFPSMVAPAIMRLPPELFPEAPAFLICRVVADSSAAHTAGRDVDRAAAHVGRCRRH